ncbi:hypothetical protein GYMLUDRAFT_55799 [Collybiopsis luxurians FD-317 M1]|nr:hypothetical protein GYMLUDRAFT_55799 [Collybiopsis luxurians FD-317 M1]
MPINVLCQFETVLYAIPPLSEEIMSNSSNSGAASPSSNESPSPVLPPPVLASLSSDQLYNLLLVAIQSNPHPPSLLPESAPAAVAALLPTLPPFTVGSLPLSKSLFNKFPLIEASTLLDIA